MAKKKTLTAKEIKELHEEIDAFLQGPEDEEVDDPQTLQSIVEESEYSTEHEEGKIGKHTYKFIHYGSTDGIDVETRDGCTTEFIFKIDGNLYAMYGYYSSHGESYIDDGDLTPVELTTRVEKYYGPVKVSK